MRIAPQSVLDLIEQLQTLVGFRALIESSLTRSRDVGSHNRHFATTLRFALDVRRVGWFMSGLRITLENGGGSWFHLDSHALAAWRRMDGGGLEIIEQFESETERRTRLSVLGPIDSPQ